MKRREFLKVAPAALVGTSLAPPSTATQVTLTPLAPVAKIAHTQQTWLGKAFWGNRLQDWQSHNGRIECLRGGPTFEIRTVSLLTRQLNSQHSAARIRMRVGNLQPGKAGFSGFLLGIGAGKLDYRASALAQHYSGTDGGFMAVIDHTGGLSFRDFSNQKEPLLFEALNRKSLSLSSKPNAISQRTIILDCHITPAINNTFEIKLIALDAHSHEELGFIVRQQVAAEELTGGISLLSSSNDAGAGWWFSQVETGGEKIDVLPEQALGPVMGCMYSLNQQVLKLTAQFMPIALTSNPTVRFEYRARSTDNWKKGPEATIEDGYVAQFRLEKWNPKLAFEYRIVYANPSRVEREYTHTDETLYTGTIAQDPQFTHRRENNLSVNQQLKIALYSCIIPTAKSLDREHYEKLIEQEAPIGRYTSDNILFPHTTLVSHCDWHQPDMYVFCGDQYYETYPTRYGRDTPDAKLDTLYRWYLWYWTFRESVRHKPCIMLADDHDVLQGNLWGNAGKDSSDGTEEGGGFNWDKSLVRMVYRIQHGHNPDPYEPTPIQNNLPVSYAEFIYGGVSFCLIEDRKFKTPPNTVVPPEKTKGELLGPRQEAFLDQWSRKDRHLPKICLTASMWGSPQTKGNAEPLLDYDSNGYPPDGRTRAVQLLKQANALVLAGDQHLAMIARQGINEFEDGPLFFAGPAAAAFWQRWFEGEGKLDNPYNEHPDTGNFTDTFGNKMRVLAVANPRISFNEFKASNKSWGNFVADHRLKSEGYGIITVDHSKQHTVLECWPWQESPSHGNQFTGWPYIHTFSEA